MSASHPDVPYGRREQIAMRVGTLRFAVRMGVKPEEEEEMEAEIARLSEEAAGLTGEEPPLRDALWWKRGPEEA